MIIVFEGSLYAGNPEAATRDYGALCIGGADLVQVLYDVSMDGLLHDPVTVTIGDCPPLSGELLVSMGGGLPDRLELDGDDLLQRLRAGDGQGLRVVFADEDGGEELTPEQALQQARGHAGVVEDDNGERVAVAEVGREAVDRNFVYWEIRKKLAARASRSRRSPSSTRRRPRRGAHSCSRICGQAGCAS